MFLIRLSILSFLLFCANQNVQAQKYYNGASEWGLIGGVSNYYGELSHKYNLKHFKPSAGLFYKKNITPYFSSKIQASYLTIQGTDKGNSQYQNRNLSFKTPVVELGALIEFNFKKFGTNFGSQNGSVYVATGINAFYFNPTRLEDTKIKLRNLETEGESYSVIQPSVPLVLGYKRMLKPKKHKGAFIIGIEASWRKTFTDRLDDVGGKYVDFATQNAKSVQAGQYAHPQTLLGNNAIAAGTMRADTHLKDWYYSLSITLSYRITPYMCARFN